MVVRVLVGDALTVLRGLPAESVQCVVTSPPYMGLRSYGTEPKAWGGDPEHIHDWTETVRRQQQPNTSGSSTLNPCPAKDNRVVRGNGEIRQAVCSCGAWRGELGLEPTPAMFIEHLILIFDEVRRVLRPDGLAFVNLGDSYAGSGKGGNVGRESIFGNIDMTKRQGFNGNMTRVEGIPAKNLLLIPERFAIAMQDAGWYVRQQIVWSKASCMPESVRDRFTSAWEPIFMFTKSPRYYFDQEAVRVPSVSPQQEAHNQRYAKAYDFGVSKDGNGQPNNTNHVGLHSRPGPGGANMRNVWHLSPEPLKESHYAAFVTEIPRRCILAGTSEKGCCPTCGAPWRRVVERESAPFEQTRRQQHLTSAQVERMQGRQSGGITSTTFGLAAHEMPARSTTGWTPSCSCPPTEPRPCVVLDPFLGAGTTALVADRLGRDCWGIELNPEYAAMARRRIEGDAPMFAQVESA